MENTTRDMQTAEFSKAFLRLQHTFSTCMQLMLSKYGLFPGQPQALFALKKLENPTQNELAAELGIGKASAGVSIRRLENSGFVKRTRDKKDTRCVRLTLTEKGKEYARWCEIDFNVFFTTMLEGFSMEERNAVHEAVLSMDDSLSSLKNRLGS